MTKRKLSVALLTVAVLSITVALISNPTKARSEAKSQSSEVRVDNFTFGPQSLTVPVNTTVTWINRDEEPHTVVSVEKQFKKSPPLDTDQEFTVVVGSPGTYSYFCSVHPKMTGTIIVKQ